MEPITTILLFVVAPVGGLALIALFSMGGRGDRPPRYRAGDSWQHDPVWWIGNPKGSGVEAPTIEAVPSGSAPIRSARGGARGTW